MFHNIPFLSSLCPSSPSNCHSFTYHISILSLTFFLVNLTRSLQTLLIFSKNWTLMLLILLILFCFQFRQSLSSLRKYFLCKVRDKELSQIAIHSPLPEGCFLKDILSPSGVKFVTLSFLDSNK